MIRTKRYLRPAPGSRPQEAETFSIPPPIGGWNARDSLADMAVDDAVVIKNFYPATTSVNVRNGYNFYVAGLTGYVDTLLAYGGPTEQFFAATSAGNIYDITQQDSFLTDQNGNYIVTEAGVQILVKGSSLTTSLTGLSNGRLQYINITTAGGSYIRTVNGVDKSRVYDGTAWHKDGDGAPYDITGVDSASLSNINLHKNRIWFTQNSTLKAWYLPTNALGGAAVSFDLSAIAQRGGYLMAMSTWTIDGGYGIDDLAVWVTSNGEVIVYRGTDPSSASTWALVGVWRIGSPVGRRCMYKWSGDLLIITQDGVFPMSLALQSSRTDARAAITNKIQYAVSNAVTNYGTNFGWQLIYFANGNQLYLNIPVLETQQQEQYVMNTITKSWCRFTGWNASCWEIFQDQIYFGTFEGVNKAWSGQIDGATAISTECVQAFSELGRKGLQKRATMFQPILSVNGSLSLFGGVNIDFDTSTSSAQLATTPSLYGAWDSGVWDTSIWGPDVDIRKIWNGAKGVGKYFAPSMNTSISNTTLQWMSSTIVFEEGGVI